MSQAYSSESGAGIDSANHYAKKLQEVNEGLQSVQAGESPRLSRKAISSLGDTEKTGVLLNSSWTLWLDRYYRYEMILGLTDDCITPSQAFEEHAGHWCGTMF